MGVLGVPEALRRVRAGGRLPSGARTVLLTEDLAGCVEQMKQPPPSASIILLFV